MTTEEPIVNTWSSEIPIGGRVVLPPDPHIIDAIGGNHRLETAVADLVDNSLDAGATDILLRFVMEHDLVRTLYVVDNGSGIAAEELDVAMTFGGRRAYSSSDLGHFGLGLKAASFSQADSLTVISRKAGGGANGRRWLASRASQHFECDVVTDEFCEREMGRSWGSVHPISGTVVRWDDIRTFPSVRNADVASRFLHDAVGRLQNHLGLVFHRFIATKRVGIAIDVWDPELMQSGPPVAVRPLDPFGYARSGVPGYPKSLHFEIGGLEYPIHCHIWPGRSQLFEFRLSSSPEDHQGLYFYRRERLLQAGGWNSLEVSRRDLQLARVSIEIDEQLIKAGALRMNPEKSRVEFGHELSSALASAHAEGSDFAGYLEDARQAFKKSNQRRRSRKATVPLGRGVPPRLKKIVRRELPHLSGHPPVDLRWRDFSDDLFFDIDRDSGVIWLNNKYRSLFPSIGRRSFNDAALLKMLMFLLAERLFHGQYLGPKDKDDLELWQSLLTVAALEQLD